MCWGHRGWLGEETAHPRRKDLGFWRLGPSLVGGGPNWPKAAKGAHYNAQRKVWTAPVELKPDWSYEFMLNSENYVGFASEQGVPLEPVSVTFKTASQKGTGQTK